MRSILTLFVVSLTAVHASVCSAADAPQVTGNLSLGTKVYKLAHVVAYPVKAGKETATTVLASDRPLNVGEIKQILLDNNGQDDKLSLRQPHVKLVFDKSGAATSSYAYADGFTTTAAGSDIAGEIKIAEGRVVGKAKMESQGEGEFQRSFDFQFAVGLLNSGAEQAPQAAPLAKIGVTGTFKGNGKIARLAYVSARRIEAFDDKPSLMLVFTEKDHAKEQRPDIKAGFGDFGSALLISCHEDGTIFGCEVAHAAHSKKPFSSVGSISTGEFQIAGGQVQGKLSTGGEVEAFGQTWEVELSFATPFTATPKAEPKVSSKPKPNTIKPAPEKPVKPALTTASLKAKELALPDNATDLDFKKLVEHIHFHHASEVMRLSADLTTRLAAQGWEKDGSDLIRPQSAIMKRKRGEASLSIFVKPGADGSEVRIFTKGLDWEK